MPFLKIPPGAFATRGTAVKTSSVEQSKLSTRIKVIGTAQDLNGRMLGDCRNVQMKTVRSYPRATR
jgi:hypothetical protein